MDFRLEQKDLVCLEDGTPQTVTGTEELLQRVMIRLTVPGGSFPTTPSWAAAGRS